MINIAYMRCNGGDYFKGEYQHCPLDGWSSPQSIELAKIIEWLKAEDREVSISSLCQAGLSDSAIERTIVIQFGSAGSVFDLIAPRGYIVNGVWHPLEKLDLGFK